MIIGVIILYIYYTIIWSHMWNSTAQQNSNKIIVRVSASKLCQHCKKKNVKVGIYIFQGLIEKCQEHNPKSIHLRQFLKSNGCKKYCDKMINGLIQVITQEIFCMNLKSIKMMKNMEQVKEQKIMKIIKNTVQGNYSESIQQFNKISASPQKLQILKKQFHVLTHSLGYKIDSLQSKNKDKETNKQIQNEDKKTNKQIQHEDKDKPRNPQNMSSSTFQYQKVAQIQQKNNNYKYEKQVEKCSVSKGPSNKTIAQKQNRKNHAIIIAFRNIQGLFHHPNTMDFQITQNRFIQIIYRHRASNQRQIQLQWRNTGLFSPFTNFFNQKQVEKVSLNDQQYVYLIGKRQKIEENVGIVLMLLQIQPKAQLQVVSKHLKHQYKQLLRSQSIISFLGYLKYQTKILLKGKKILKNFLYFFSQCLHQTAIIQLLSAIVQIPDISLNYQTGSSWGHRRYIDKQYVINQNDAFQLLQLSFIISKAQFEQSNKKQKCFNNMLQIMILSFRRLRSQNNNQYKEKFNKFIEQMLQKYSYSLFKKNIRYTKMLLNNSKNDICSFTKMQLTALSIQYQTNYYGQICFRNNTYTQNKQLINQLLAEIINLIKNNQVRECSRSVSQFFNILFEVPSLFTNQQFIKIYDINKQKSQQLQKIRHKMSSKIMDFSQKYLEKFRTSLDSQQKSNIIRLLVSYPIIQRQQKLLKICFRQIRSKDLQSLLMAIYVKQASIKINFQKLNENLLYKWQNDRENPFIVNLKIIDNASMQTKEEFKNQIVELAFNYINQFKKPKNYIENLQLYKQIQNSEIKELLFRQICRQLNSDNNKQTELNRIGDRFTKDDKTLQNLYAYIFADVKQNQQEIIKQVIDVIINHPQMIRHNRLKYKKIFPNAVKQLINNIEQLRIAQNDLNKLLQLKCTQESLQIQFILKVANKSANIAEQIKNNYSKLSSIFQSYASLQEDAQNIQNIMTQLQNKLIGQWQQQKYKNIASNSNNIQILINHTQIWNNQDNFDIESLLIQYQRCCEQLKSMIQDLFNNQLMYSDYIKAFKPQTKPIITKLTQRKEILNIIDYFENSSMENYLNLMQGLSFYNESCGKQTDDQWFHEIIELLEDPQDNIIDILKTYQILQEGREHFQKISSFELTQTNREQIKILSGWKKCKSIFQMIQRNKLTITIIDDLKEYINDIENSTLRLNDIKSFQTVLIFYELLKKAKIQVFFETLKKIQQQRAWCLSRDINDSFTHLTMIQQKIDESKNRQTSFKYDIADILNNSKLVIKIQNYIIKISIDAQVVLESEQQMQHVKYRHFQMKLLQSYKDKSLLLVTDSRREQIQDDRTISIIQLLKKYLQLFDIIQEIQSISNKLLNYGYNPEGIKQQAVIRNENFARVQQASKKLSQISKQWIKQVTCIYNESYILTHFVGKQLYLLVKKISNNKFPEQLQHLFSITRGQFDKICRQYEANHNIQIQQNCIPDENIQNLKKVNNILQQLSDQKLSGIKQQHQHRIELVTCKQESEYYCFLTENGQMPKINQILYCQAQTSIESIDCFLKRALLRQSQKHYIIAVHYLSIQKQQSFCDLLNNIVRNRHQEFRRTQLCFIDRSIVQKVYIHLCRDQIFSVAKKSVIHMTQSSQKFVQMLHNVTVIASESSGQGKTFYSEKSARQEGKELKYFPICGNVDFNNLSQRLKNLNLSQNHSLLIQIGHVENKRKLDIFLFQLLTFKAFSYEGFQFLPQDIQIYVEIQNILDSVLQNHSKELIPREYNILNMIREQSSKFQYLRQFSLDSLQIDMNDFKQHFILLYLNKFDKRQLNSEQYISYQEFSNQALQDREKIDKNRAKELIETHYLKNLRQQPTYRLYKYWVKLFFEYVSTFSNSIYFNVYFLEEDHKMVRHLELNRVRQTFIGICIKNSIQFLQQTQNTNEFQLNQQKKDFRHKLQQFPLLILPNYDRQGFQFVYLDDKVVDLPIKSLKLTQQTDQNIRRKMNNITQISQVHDLFHEKSLNNLDEIQLEIQIYRFINRLSNCQKFRIYDSNEAKLNKTTQRNHLNHLKQIYPQLNNYSFTLDNFFKMCLIIQRMRSQLPIVLMGESGVGKTALIRFLAQQVFSDQFICFNIHAGINQSRITDMAKQIFQRSQATEKKIWVFFDQFNTTDELSYFKEMIIDRRYQGQRFSDKIIFLAACNPFRRKKIARHKNAGLKRSLQDSCQNLAFKVKFPPLAMISVMWDYQQLRQKQNQSYISKMIEQLKFDKHDQLVHTLTVIHQYLKSNKQISSVSLRDIYRFKQITIWFKNNMPGKQKNQKGKNIKNPNYQMDRNLRAIILGIGFCYGMRLSQNKERRQLYNLIQDLMGLKPKKYSIEKILQNQQIDYVQKMSIPSQKIALNRALRENVFVILVSIMNKIPVLIVGNPGNSKSLSIRMLASNLRGNNSQKQFCRKFNEFNMIYFQGSQACTSKGIEQVFEKAKASRRQFAEKFKDKQQYYKPPQNCIYFDEIGLAEKSIHNPLKVLHSQLQTTNKQICFIGISNWQLDASKMSRFLILARCTPDLEELEITAQKILESYSKDPNQSHRKKMRQMAKYYYEFIQQWDQRQQIKGFFGLRDFYCYIKYVCEKIYQASQDSIINIDKLIYESIATNFDGQPRSLEMFYKIAKIQSFYHRQINPLDLVNANLQNPNSRCLLLIIRGDALVPLINNSIKVHGQHRNVVCMYGSTFKSDKSSEQYNLEITSLIISHISRGNILAFKDINSSIETSLYDLFNKSFYQVGNKKYCRIAVGANLNPKCLVHNKFNAIVYIDESNIENTDLAFLNRFEKHYLNLKLIANQQQRQIIRQVVDWIDRILIFTNKIRLKKQNFIINCCEESIVTLVIKYRQSKLSRENKTRQIKKQLLINSTLDFKIAVQQSYIIQQYERQIKQMLQQISQGFFITQKQRIPKKQNKTFFDQKRMISEQEMDLQSMQKENLMMDEQQQLNNKLQNSREDLIVFTYDQNLDAATDYRLQSQKTYKFRLSSIKGQRELRSQLQKALKLQNIDNIHIMLNYERQNQHLDLLLFISQSMRQYSSTRIIIIVQISRFSLINGAIEAINISYLHKFKQIFIQDLTINNKTEKILNLKWMHDLINYLKFNDADEISDLYVKGLKMFDFRSDKQVFESVYRLAGEKLFLNMALQYVIFEAQKKQIDYRFLLEMKDEASFCASVFEAVRQYVQNFISRKLIYFTDYLLKKSLVHLFPINLKIIFPQELNRIIERSQEAYQDILKKAIDGIKQYKNRNQLSYVLQGNMVPRIQKNIFPLFSSFENFIFSKNQDDQTSIQSISKKIFALQSQKQSQKHDNHQLLADQIVKSFNEKSWISFELIQSEFLMSFTGIEKIFIYDFLVRAFNIDRKQFSKVINIQEFLANLLSQFSTPQKITVLLANRKIFSHFIQFINIVVDNDKGMIEDFSEAIQMLDHPVQQMIEIINKSVQVYEQKMFISRNILQQLGPQKYLNLFTLSYYYLQQIRIQFQYYNIRLPSNLKICKKFLQLLSSLSRNQSERHHLLLDFVQNMTNMSFESEVNAFLMRIRQKYDHNQQKSLYTYLALEVYPNWGKIQQQQSQCIDNFIRLSNLSASFSDNAIQFIEHIFDDFIDLQFQQKWQYLQNPPQNIDKSIIKHINFQDNFSVSIGNWLNIQIYQDDEQQIDPDLYNKKFQQIFEQKFANPLYQLGLLEFCKNYLVYFYLNSLQDGNMSEQMAQIDNLLCKKCLISEQLRLYLFKQLFDIYKEKKLIKQEYVDKNKCQWIKFCTQFLQQKNIHTIIPPKLQNTKQITQKMDEFVESNYLDKQILHGFISKSFQNAQNKFQLFNFLLVNCYSRLCPPQQIHQIQRQISERGDINQPNNQIEMQLIRGYITHQITPSKQFKQANNQQQFLKTQLFELVAINFFIACRFKKCPFIETTFNMHGGVPNDYSKWINERFIPLGLQNLAARTIRIHLQAKKETNLHHCSNNCDYIYEIANCQKPYQQGKCPWCQQIIGGKDHVYTRANQGARPILRGQMQNEYARIQQLNALKKDNTIINLMGYGLGGSHDKIIENIQQNQRIPRVAKYYLFLMQAILWKYLAETRNITPKEVQKTFGMNIDRFINQISLVINILDKKLQNNLGLTEQQLLSWKFGIVNKLLQTVSNYEDKFQPTQRKNTIGLKQVFHRDKLQQILSNQIITYSGGHQKLNLVNQSLIYKESQLDHSSNLIKQQFQPNFYFKKYPKIRMLKLNDRVSLQNFRQSYILTVQTTHPLLYYVLGKQKILQDVQKNCVLFQFVAKLIQMVSFKITREEASKTGFIELIKSSPESQKQKLQPLYHKFVQRWNELALDKVMVKDMCKQFGYIEIIDRQNFESYPILNFLPDRDHPQNIPGYLIMFFLILKANEYNQVYRQALSIIQRISQYKNDPIFSTQTYNIMNLSNFDSQKIASCSENDIWKIINNYSSMSVQYGIKIPNYPLDKIQSVIIDKFFTNKSLIQASKQKIQTVNFIGELSLLLSKISDSIEQTKLGSIGRKPEIQNFLIGMHRGNPQVYHKYLKKVLGQIQCLMFYCKNLRPDKTITISEFLIKSHLQKTAQQLMVEPYRSLPLSVLVNLYELVQSKTFDQDFRLDPSYCQSLDRPQKDTLIELKKTLKQRGEKQGYDYLDQLTIALFRFMTRMLFMMKVGTDVDIADWLGQQQFWSGGKPFFEDEKVEDALRMPTSKMGAITKLFKDNIKKTLQQHIKPVETVNIRKQQRLQKPKIAKKRRQMMD